MAKRMTRVVGLALAGALVGYWLNRWFGRRRQARALTDQAGYVDGMGEGTLARAGHVGQATPAQDRAIGELLRGAVAGLDFPTIDVSVEVINGVATLRGDVAHPEEVEAVERVAAGVTGVRRVDSYLHLPGMPAPSKAAAIDARR